VYEEASDMQEKLKLLFDMDYAKKHNTLLSDYLQLKKESDHLKEKLALSTKQYTELKSKLQTLQEEHSSDHSLSQSL